jgi:hypothetical protein
MVNRRPTQSLEPGDVQLRSETHYQAAAFFRRISRVHFAVARKLHLLPTADAAEFQASVHDKVAAGGPWNTSVCG